MSAGDGPRPGRAPRQINLRLLLPLMVSTMLIQLVTPLLRIGTSYKALDGDLSSATVGVLSAAFALSPVLLAVPVGRFNDRRGEGPSAIAGSVLILVSALGLWLAPVSLESLLLFTCTLGFGQLFLLSALQSMTTRCSGPQHHDAVLGYFMIAVSIGQILAPLVVSLTTPAGAIYPGEALFVVSVAAAACMPLFGVLLALFLPRQDRILPREQMPLKQVLGTPNLLWIILASSLAVTANDLILVFFPVLGVAAGIDAATVGWLLTARSVASMASRLFFSRLAVRFGHVPLLIVSMAAAGLATATFAVELPVWAMAIAMTVAGLGFGLALTAGISLTIRIAPPQSRSTALSLRLTASRFGQFAVPLVSAGIAATVGAGAIFAVLGVGLLASAALVRARVGRKPGPPTT